MAGLLRLLVVLLAAWTTLGGEQRQPPAAQVPSGTIIGSVLDADSGRPVRFAKVALGGAGDFATATDDGGVFAFETLPAGTYRLTVTAPGYLTTTYGQARPGTQTRGTWIRLRDGERRDRLVIPLSRGGSIAGVVRDDRGDPVFGATITVLRGVSHHGARDLEPVASVESDDRGAYRVPLLPPRRYVVSASSSRTIEAPSGPHGHAPTFNASASPGDAESVAIGLGEDRSDIDIQLLLVPLSRVTGRVFDAAGRPATGIPVSLTTAEPGGVSQKATTTNDEGRFRFEQVGPGVHLVEATTRSHSVRVVGDGTKVMTAGAISFRSRDATAQSGNSTVPAA